MIRQSTLYNIIRNNYQGIFEELNTHITLIYNKQEINLYYYNIDDITYSFLYDEFIIYFGLTQEITIKNKKYKYDIIENYYTKTIIIIIE